MIKKMKALLFVLPLVMCTLSLTALANGESEIISKRTNDENISVYVKGVESFSAGSCIVGNKEAAIESSTAILELPTSIETLVLIDNSASISKEERKKTSEILHLLVGGMSSSEKMAIGTFTEDIVYLCDYSNNAEALNTAIDSITYQDQDAFLSDVLYNLLQSDSSTEDVFKRIIVVSDGADSNPKNVSQAEMNSLLENSTIPIYVLGCTSKNNDEILQNMFAFARLTKGKAFLLADYSSVSDIISVLDDDKSIVKFVIKPSPESMDGLVKAVRLVLDDEVLSIECKMPQVVLEEVVEEPVEEEKNETVAEQLAEETPVVTTEPVAEEVKPSEQVKEESKGGFNILFVIISIGLVAVVAAVVIVHKKKSAGGNAGGALTNSAAPAGFAVPGYGAPGAGNGANGPTRDSNETVMLGEETVLLSDNDRTEILGNDEQGACTVVLTVAYDPSKQFVCPIYDTAVIGRQPQGSNIVIDFDKTVSGRHCALIRRDNQLFIKDLNSSNGTFVNGNRIFDEALVNLGDKLTLGRLELIINMM